MTASLLRDILPLLTPQDRRQWPILLVSSLLAGVSRSAFLALVNAAIAVGAHWEALRPYLLGIMALIAVVLGADFFNAVRGRRVTTGVALRLRCHLLDRIGLTNLQLLEREGANNLHYRLMHTTGVVAGAYGLMLGFANSLVTLSFNIAYIAWLSVTALIVALAIILVGVTVNWRIEEMNRARRKVLQRLNQSASGYNNAYLLAFKELRLSARKTADYRGLIDDNCAALIRENVAEARITGLGSAATNLFEFTALAAVAMLLPFLDSGSAIVRLQILTAILFTIGPLSGVVGAFSGFGQARVEVDNLKKLMAQIDAMQEPAALPSLDRLPPFESVTLEEVEFSFRNPDSAETREDFHFGPVNLAIHRGEVVCIVGGNGSGKTVMMRLLTGLYRPRAGRILWNGAPLAEADRQKYRENFSAVFGDFFLFSELLGHRDIEAETVNRLLKQFDLGGKIEFESGNFSTVALSTGQRKRLALIVSILDGRPILVLDEFGADQDPEHRRAFYEEWLPELRRRGMTVIVVTHDDAYFGAADVLVRMDFGKIVEYRRRSAGA